MTLPDKVPESVTMQNVLQALRTVNKTVEYLRSLQPIPTNTAPGAHTALGTFGGSNGTSTPTPAKKEAPRWG
jgi:hypothetical protein